MKNLLLATDLTINADRALERAIKLAHKLGATLHILHVTPVYLLPDRKKQTAALKDDTTEIIRAYLDNYGEAKKLKTVVHVINGGEPFAEIISYAQKNKADLVIMGMHNKSGFRDLFIGTTVERVIRTGSKPVLMVTDKPKDGYTNVLAGMDFSEGAKAALATALRIAPGADIRVIHAYEFPDTTTGDRIERFVGDVVEGIEADKLQTFAKDCKKALKKHNLQPEDFSYATLKGNPAKVLAAEARKIGADLLAVGANSRAHFAISKLGGTTEDMLTDPPCDILVAKGLI